jgi:hypothetical protein
MVNEAYDYGDTINYDELLQTGKIFFFKLLCRLSTNNKLTTCQYKEYEQNAYR